MKWEVNWSSIFRLVYIIFVIEVVTPFIPINAEGGDTSLEIVLVARLERNQTPKIARLLSTNSYPLKTITHYAKVQKVSR